MKPQTFTKTAQSWALYGMAWLAVSTNGQTPTPAAFGQPSEQWLTQGLVAFFPLDGNANDASGNANHAEAHGAFQANDRFGKANSACGFDGVKSYIEVPDGRAFKSRSFTLSLWFNATKFPGNTALTEAEFLVSKGQNNFEFHLGAPGRDTSGASGMRFLPRTGPGAHWDTPSASYALNRWHHLTVTYDPVAKVVGTFIDGRAMRLTGPVLTPSTPDKPGNARFGMRTDGTLGFHGKLDDIRIYDRALSADEVKRLFAHESGSNSGPPLTTAKNNSKPPVPAPTSSNLPSDLSPPAPLTPIPTPATLQPATDSALTAPALPAPTNKVATISLGVAEVNVFDSKGVVVKIEERLKRIPIKDLTENDLRTLLETPKAYQAIGEFKSIGKRIPSSESFEMRLHEYWSEGKSLHERVNARFALLDALRAYNAAIATHAALSGTTAAAISQVGNAQSRAADASEAADRAAVAADNAAALRRDAALLGSSSRSVLGVSSSTARMLSKTIDGISAKADEAENAAIRAANAAAQTAQNNAARLAALTREIEARQAQLNGMGFPVPTGQPYRMIPPLSATAGIDLERAKNASP